MRSRRSHGTSGGRRATSPAVGMSLLVALTVVLASSLGVAAAVAAVSEEPAPQVRVDGALGADDGWPDGQVLELTHVAGETLAVDRLAVMIHLSQTSDPVRVTGFPTRRLTDEHVHGPAVVDRSFAGVDGALDAAHSDGHWSSGETAEIRFASGDYDVRPGEEVRVVLVHTATDAVLAERVVTAS